MIGQKRTRFSVSLLIAAALLLMVYSLFAPARAMAVVRHALSVFAASVLPSLALFSVCAKILVKADAVRLLRALPLGGFLRMIGVSRRSSSVLSPVFPRAHPSSQSFAKKARSIRARHRRCFRFVTKRARLSSWERSEKRSFTNADWAYFYSRRKRSPPFLVFV